METKMTCAVCSEEFVALRNDAMYCSNKCKQRKKYANKRQAYTSKPCRNCGIEIFTNDNRVSYCSIECRVISRIKRS